MFPRKQTRNRAKSAKVYCKPGTSLPIKCFSAKPEKLFVFDAVELSQQLKQKFGL